MNGWGLEWCVSDIMKVSGLFMDSEICIFGAHSRARTLCAYLTALHPSCRVLAYLTDNDELNPDMIDGVPVCSPADADPTRPVYIATRGVYHEDITARLKETGFRDIRPVTPEMDTELRNAYLEKALPAMGRRFKKVTDLAPESDRIKSGSGKPHDAYAMKTACIYVVQTVFDTPPEQGMRLQPYERIIQAGAALTAERLPDAACTDCDTETFAAGEVSANTPTERGTASAPPSDFAEMPPHISHRNPQFCELTALYRMWKHTTEDIVGLAHYRRHFILPDDWVLRMVNDKVDVILPVPLYVAPSIAGNYLERHCEADWNYMLEVLGKRNAEERQKAEAFFETPFYSPCNMFIMRKEVLDAFCEWMFPVVFAVAEHAGQKEDAYQNRYPGFLSERLLTFFFESLHTKDFRLVYADKNFLV